MRQLLIPALTGLLGLAASPAFAQTTVLNQLEQRLQGTPPASAGVTEPAPTPAPAVGYMGAEFEEKAEPGRGVKVLYVRPGMPAAMGGLRVNDIISAVDGKPVTSWPQLEPILDKAPPGQKLQMTVERGTQKQELTITLGNRPPPERGAQRPSDSPVTPSLGAATTTPEATFPPATTSPSLLPSTSPSVLPGTTAPRAADSTTRPPLNLGSPPPETPADTTPGGGFRATPGFGSAGNASLGITVIPLTDQAKAEFGFPVSRGAFVDIVKQGSAAETAGLPPKSLIVRMNSRPINSPDDLVSAVHAALPGQEVELQYYVGSDDVKTKTVRLGTAAPSAPAIGVSPSLGGVAPPGTTLPGSSYPGSPFGPSANPLAAAPPVGDSPLRLGGAGPGGGLLGRVERSMGNMARPTPGGGGIGSGVAARGASTVYDPLQMAALQKAVDDLTSVVSSLEQRLKAIEAKEGGGTSAPSSTPGFNPTANPGLGSPSAAGTNP